MQYRSGYKHQLAVTEQFQTAFRPSHVVTLPFLILTPDGVLTCIMGYAWDGPSGPVIDRDTNMRASLVHDALYQLMRNGKLSKGEWRKADKEYAKALKEDGAWTITIKIDMLGLKFAGGAAAREDHKKKIHTAPKRNRKHADRNTNHYF